MKIPINWLKEFVNLPKEISVLTDKLTMAGHMLDKVENLNDEKVLDLELRGNRADCYSIYGIAKEVSALFQTRIRSLQTIPLLPAKKFDGPSLKIETSLVKRVGMVILKNVRIQPSPKWLQDRLTALGIQPLNNIVDLTNYVMIETGEPMHAFDLDKLDSDLTIRMAKNGELMTTFQDSKVALTNKDLVWAMGNKVLSIAGAVGEKHHSISALTKNILLEAANYERSNIRRTVYRHNLLTEAGIRHEKELDPNLVETAISRFLYLIKKENWGHFESTMFDYYPKKINTWQIVLDLEHFNAVSGVTLTATQISKILGRLNFKIQKRQAGQLIVDIPTYRTDVRLQEDLIEEVLRLYGYDNIPNKILSLEIPKDVTPHYISQENFLREASTSLGFDENITSSFIKEKYKNNNVELLNPPSPDTKYLRSSLLENLKDAAVKIINERGDLVQLFEIGKTYHKQGKKYLEKRKIGFVFWHKHELSFLKFKSLVLAFFKAAKHSAPDFELSSTNRKLENSYFLILNGKEVGMGGVSDNIFFLELDLDILLTEPKKVTVGLWPKYPPQLEDITLIVPPRTYIGKVVDAIKSSSKLIAKVELADIFENAYTFRVEYQDQSNTLTDKEVANTREKFLQLIKKKFGVAVKS